MNHMIENSPELRTLRSKLANCANIRDNRASILEKSVLAKMEQVKDQEYAKNIKCLDEQERLSIAISQEAKRAEALKTHRSLQEQIYAKKLEVLEKEADHVIEILSKEDEEKLLKIEQEEKLLLKLKRNKEMQLNLSKQLKLKELKQHEEQAMEAVLEKNAEELSLCAELEREMENQQLQIKQLQKNYQEFRMVKKLEIVQEKEIELQNLRQEVEIIEHNSEELKKAKQNEQKRMEDRQKIKHSLDLQIREKEQILQNQKMVEEEYKQTLLEILAQEAQLDRLVTAARRRKILDHRNLVDRIADDRRRRQEERIRAERQQDEKLVEYQQLRENLLKEEEKKLLMQHAPHLLPFLTPDLLQQLTKLGSCS